MMQEIDELKKEIEELKTCKENLLRELNKEATFKALDLKNYQMRETALVNTLAEKNEEIEKLKELNEYLRNQLRMSTDMLKETRLKIETKDAEIKKLKKKDGKSQLAILAGAYAIHKHFDKGAYYSIATNGLISWERAEQILMDMVTKE